MGGILDRKALPCIKVRGVNRKGVPDIADLHLSAQTLTRLPGEVRFVCDRPIQANKRTQ